MRSGPAIYGCTLVPRFLQSEDFAESLSENPENRGLGQDGYWFWDRDLLPLCSGGLARFVRNGFMTMDFGALR